MIICTDKYVNTSITIKGEDVKFVKGKAEVSEEVGNHTLANFKDFWEEGKRPVPEIKLKEATNVDEYKEQIDSLKKQIISLSQKNGDLKSKLEVSDQSVKDWKEVVEKMKLEDTNPDNKGGNDSDLPRITEDDVRLVLDLNKETVTDIQSKCNEMNFPKEEWEELKKEGLIVYLVLKALNA